MLWSPILHDIRQVYQIWPGPRSQHVHVGRVEKEVILFILGAHGSDALSLRFAIDMRQLLSRRGTAERLHLVHPKGTLI